MYCHSCGKQIPDQARFCPHCGAATVSAAPIPGGGGGGTGGDKAARTSRPPKTGGGKRLVILIAVVVAAVAAVAAVTLLRGRAGGGSGTVQSNLYIGRGKTVRAGDYILGSAENYAGDAAVFRLEQDASGYFEKSDDHFTEVSSQYVNVNGTVYALTHNSELSRLDPERMASEVVYRPADGDVEYIAGVADDRLYFVTDSKPIYGSENAYKYASSGQSNDYPCLQHLNADGSVETDFTLPDNVYVNVGENGVYLRDEETGSLSLCDFSGSYIADVGYPDRSYSFLRETDKYAYFRTESGMVCADKKTGQLIADLRSKLEAQYPDMFSSGLYSWNIDCYDGQLYVLAMDRDQRTVLYKVDEDGKDFKAQVMGQMYLDYSTNNGLWVTPFMVDKDHCLIQVSNGTRNNWWETIVIH